jgi:Protein of unknown function (DUF993)
MNARVLLPGRSRPLEVRTPQWAASYPPPASRRVYAAAHVAARPAAPAAAPAVAEIDWAATLRFREHLWAHGFGVAEAMDTAQRGMGLTWARARELIERSAVRAMERRAGGGFADLACGAGTDQLAPGDRWSMADIIGAYTEQMEFVQSHGADVIVMASRALAATARGPRDYIEVYATVLKQAERPVILHWLGEAFDPALRGYWGGADFDVASSTVLELMEQAGEKVGGIKLSVLDAGQELALRRRLPRGVRLYTGDDFNYADLIRGDATGHSDALLGAFAAITAPAAAALRALEDGDVDGYDAAIGPTVPLSRLIFEQPTPYYKTGVAFLAWLNGLQPHFTMVGGLERARPVGHLIRVFELAAGAGALADPELAADRMTGLLADRS